MSAPDRTIARVLCDASGPDRAFDYEVPPTLVGTIEIGTQVRVDLNGRRIGGWVVAIESSRDSIDRELLPIRKVSGVGPDEEVVEVSRWAAHRWAGRWSHFLRAASPPRHVTRVGASLRTMMSPEPRSPATTRALVAGGAVLRLPPTSDVLPAVWSCLQRGSVLVLVPGIDDAKVLAARVRRAGSSVALLPDEWARSAAGVDVVIGTRTAIFGRCTDLQSVLIIDEHDERYYSEASPTWNARDVAVERCRRLSIPLVLISSVPSPEAAVDREIIAPSRDREVAGWPNIVVAPLRDDAAPAVGRLSSEVIAELRDQQRRVLCIANTSGRSALLSCRACSELVRCEHCDAIVSQRSDAQLSCRVCGSERPAVCVSCGSTALLNLRPGVRRLVEELAAAGNREARVIEGDEEPSWKDGAASAEIIVGTEALLHRIRFAESVVFLDFERELFAPRMRAVQHASELVARAARIVGRVADGGRVVLQVDHRGHPLVEALSRVDPAAVTEHEIATREMLSLPPFGSVAFIEGHGAQEFVAHVQGDVMVGGLGESVQVRATSAELLADALAHGVRPARGRLRVAVDP